MAKTIEEIEKLLEELTVKVSQISTPHKLEGRAEIEKQIEDLKVELNAKYEALHSEAKKDPKHECFWCH